MATSRQLGAVNRKLIIWLGIAALIVVSAIVFDSVVKHRYAHERKIWKENALARLAKTSITNEEVLAEIDQIKHPTRDVNFGWTHEHVALMTNGEYLVFASRHGFDNGFVDHLFLAHGSDGRWYYSTYHFCNGMAGADPDPPGSIAEFVTKYAVREFDGVSDVCLQHTWPEKR
jgi:hypothetical protein